MDLVSASNQRTPREVCPLKSCSNASQPASRKLSRILLLRIGGVSSLAAQRHVMFICLYMPLRYHHTFGLPQLNSSFPDQRGNPSPPSRQELGVQHYCRLNDVLNGRNSVSLWGR